MLQGDNINMEVRIKLQQTVRVYVNLWIYTIKFLLEAIFYDYICRLPVRSLQILRDEYAARVNSESRMVDAAHVVPKEAWINTLFTYKSYCMSYRARYLDWMKIVKTNGPAVNCDVIKLDGTKAKLLDYMKAGRPLVLNFGSCT